MCDIILTNTYYHGNHMASIGGIILKNDTDSITVASSHDFFIDEVKDYFRDAIKELKDMIAALEKCDGLLPATKYWLDDLKKYAAEIDEKNIFDLAKTMFMKELLFFFRLNKDKVDNYVSYLLKVNPVSGEQEYTNIDFEKDGRGSKFINNNDVVLNNEYKVLRVLLAGTNDYTDVKYKGISEKDLITKIHQMPVFFSELFLLAKEKREGLENENTFATLHSVYNKLEFYTKKRSWNSDKVELLQTEEEECDFMNKKIDMVNRLIPLNFSYYEFASAIIMMLPANVYPLTDGEASYTAKREPDARIYIEDQRLTRIYSIHEKEEFSDVCKEKYLSTCDRVNAIWEKIGRKNILDLKTIFKVDDCGEKNIYTDIDVDIIIQLNPLDYS